MSAHIEAADALLRTAGGRSVLLQIPAPAVPGDLGEQIGLATPTFQALTLGPAVLRKVRAKIASFENERAAEYELLLSASSVTKAVGSLDFNSADVLFAQAAGIVVEGVTMEITSVTSSEAFGQVYLYRLGLRAPAASLT